MKKLIVLSLMLTILSGCVIAAHKDQDGNRSWILSLGSRSQIEGFKSGHVTKTTKTGLVIEKANTEVQGELIEAAARGAASGAK